MYSCSIPQVLRASQIELWVMESERLHEVNCRNPQFDSPLKAFSVQSFCGSLNDPSHGKNAGTLPDLRIEFDQVWNEVCCTRKSKTVCTRLAKYKSGDSYRRLLRSLFRVVNF